MGKALGVFLLSADCPVLHRSGENLILPSEMLLLPAPAAEGSPPVIPPSILSIQLLDKLFLAPLPDVGYKGYLEIFSCEREADKEELVRTVLTTVILILAAIPVTIRFVGGIGMDEHDYYSDVIILEETRADQRFLPLEGTLNTRDIGGYPAAGDVWVREGLVYRSDDLSMLSEEDRDFLEQLGLATVVDLREKARKEKYQNNVPERIEQYWLPIYDRTKPLHIPLLFRRSTISEVFQESYIEYIEQWGARMKPVFELFAQEDAYPILFHCTNGKDRVGVITALLLSTLGVPREYIVSDYSLSNKHLPEIIGRFIEHQEGSMLLRMGIPRDDFTEIMGVRSQWMEYFLNYVERTYGSAESYLTEHAGISKETLEEIRSLLLTEHSPWLH